MQPRGLDAASRSLESANARRLPSFSPLSSLRKRADSPPSLPSRACESAQTPSSCPLSSLQRRADAFRPSPSRSAPLLPFLSAFLSPSPPVPVLGASFPRLLPLPRAPIDASHPGIPPPPSFSHRRTSHPPFLLPAPPLSLSLPLSPRFRCFPSAPHFPRRRALFCLPPASIPPPLAPLPPPSPSRFRCSAFPSPPRSGGATGAHRRRAPPSGAPVPVRSASLPRRSDRFRRQ